MRLDNVQKFNLVVLSLLFIYSNAFAIKNPCPQDTKELPYNYKKGSFRSGVVDSIFAEKIFSRIQDPKLNLSLDYVVDGCDMRAYMISKYLKESNNLNTFRVALETKSSEGLVVETNKTHEGLVEFSRHTATALCVLNPSTNTVEPYVLDPVFFTAPVKLESWAQKFTSKTKSKTDMYFSSMYSLNPQVPRTQFHAGELSEALALQRLFAKALKKHNQAGTKPYGLGRSRENVRDLGLSTGFDFTTE